MKSAKRKKSLRTALAWLLILLLSVSTVGCSRLSFVSDEENVEPPSGTPPVEDTPAITPPVPEPIVYYNRYTGLACDEALLSCRPISVLMGNFDGNRQEGLSFADILIEAPIDGDKTRLWAILTNPAAAGTLSPVATVRDYMMPISRAFGAISAYAGTTDVIGAPTTVHAGDNLDYLYHNLSATFTRGEGGVLQTGGSALLAAAKSRAYSVKDTECTLPYRFAAVGETFVPQGNPVRSVRFRFSMANTVSFRYENGLYLRDQNGVPHVDEATGETLSYANVLLLFHNVNYYHTATETTFSLDTESGGEGYCYTGGGVVAVRWGYGSDGTLSIRDEEGEAITLNRGRTYIGMLRVTDSTTIVAK